MPLTLEERERRAYIEGRVEEATVLGAAVDAENDEIQRLEWEVERLEADSRGLESQLEGQQERIEELEGQLAAWLD